MAYRDYIHCADCDCKLIYDGDDNTREWFEECYGDPSADTWTAEIVCPDCLKKLRAKLSAAPKVEQEPAYTFHLDETGRAYLKGVCVSQDGDPIYTAPPVTQIPQEWMDSVEKAIESLEHCHAKNIQIDIERRKALISDLRALVKELK